MAAVTTVRDMLCHYTFSRGIYERLIGDCNCHPQVARNIVALLLWFDQATNKIISQLPSMSTTALAHLLNEASCVIHCLRMRNVPDPPTPLLSSLCQDSHLDHPRFFAFNQGRIARGVADLLDGVCTLIFDDRLYHLLRRYQTGLVGRNQELEAPYERVVITVQSKGQPVEGDAPCARSMFVTFSKGQPVEGDDIFSYFRETWGDCIVRVLMQKTTDRAQPMYGRNIFKSKAFVSLVLNGAKRASLFIGGREIWLREYIPRNSSDN